MIKINGIELDQWMKEVEEKLDFIMEHTNSEYGCWCDTLKDHFKHLKNLEKFNDTTKQEDTLSG